MIYYLRDSNSKLIGIKYNEDLYYYQKNAQEDIIGLLDSNYNLIATYEYDSWGNVITIKDALGNIISDANNIAIINPYRYRSYYYDKETNLYYLNSRYYNPIWGRFINADGIINADKKILGYNILGYVNNNPIMYSDYEGTSLFWSLLITAGVGAVSGVAAQGTVDAVYSLCTRSNKFSGWQSYVGAATGGAAGSLIGTGPFVSGFSGAAISTAASQVLENYTGGEYRTPTDIALNSLGSGLVGGAASSLMPKIKGINSGRNSYSAVFTSGVTKLSNNTASRMSANVIAKGFITNYVSEVGGSAALSFTNKALESEACFPSTNDEQQVLAEFPPKFIYAPYGVLE